MHYVNPFYEMVFVICRRMMSWSGWHYNGLVCKFTVFLKAFISILFYFILTVSSGPQTVFYVCLFICLPISSGPLVCVCV